MKRILTAIGSEELNTILKMQKDIEVVGTDIQYQEGVVEALEKYQNIDIVILNENIIGELDLEDLIRSIVILRNNIEIILIAEEIEELEDIKNITKTVNNKTNYVDTIIKYLIGDIYIKKEPIVILQEMKEDRRNITRQIQKEKIRIEKNSRAWSYFCKAKKYLKSVIRKKEKRKEVITIIGSPGIRKNKFYINIFENL